MKVKELVEELKQYNQEAEVILSSDEEGNSYSTLDKQSIDLYKGKVILYPWHEGIEI
jgi:hypothetical protein